MGSIDDTADDPADDPDGSDEVTDPPPDDDVTHPPPSSDCQFMTPDPSRQVAFCESFDAPTNLGTRSGDLNGDLWGVSRMDLGGVNLGQGDIGIWGIPQLERCGETIQVQPPDDVAVCNGMLVEAMEDNGSVTTLAMYPKQPFDISGRTGTVVFDVSNDSVGSHGAWPEFWYTDIAVPAPFTHANRAGAGANAGPVPEHGLGIRFHAVCAAPGAGGCGCKDANHARDVFSVGSAIVISDYVPHDTETDLAGSSMEIERFDCVESSTGPGDMNHIELRISQNEIEVYATDAGTTSPLKLIAIISNPDLTLSRGVIWMEDAHYNGRKEGNLRPQGVHTFSWDNVGFDGPVLERDLAFDLLDRNQPSGIDLNIGWLIPLDGTPLSLDVPGVRGLESASDARLAFTFYAIDPRPEISYQLNGGSWHAFPWVFPPDDGVGARTIGIPIPISELRDGANNVQFKASAFTSVQNVDIILHGAGD